MIRSNMSLVAGLLLCLAALAHAQEFSGPGPCTTQGELFDAVRALLMAFILLVKHFQHHSGPNFGNVQFRACC
jgi:hypothetical protein